jgi:hypothetical protein
MIRRIALIVLVLAALALITTGCEGGGDKAEQRANRSGDQVEYRTDRAIDDAGDRALDSVFK